MLAEYDCPIEHHKGKNNKNTDALSKIHLTEAVNFVAHINFVTIQMYLLMLVLNRQTEAGNIFSIQLEKLKGNNVEFF